MVTSVQITESFKPLLDHLLVSGTSSEDIGSNVVKLIKDHFRSLPANERGFPSTGFWQRAAEAIHFAITDDGVLITIDQVGVRQRYFGGVIQPFRARYLTIPAIAETYGCSASDFPDLKVVRGDFVTWWGSHASLALVPADQKVDQTDSGNIFFWLVSRAVQEPNHGVLPSDDEISASVLDPMIQQLDTPFGNLHEK